MIDAEFAFEMMVKIELDISSRGSYPRQQQKSGVRSLAIVAAEQTAAS